MSKPDIHPIILSLINGDAIRRYCGSGDVHDQSNWLYVRWNRSCESIPNLTIHGFGSAYYNDLIIYDIISDPGQWEECPDDTNQAPLKETAQNAELTQDPLDDHPVRSRDCVERIKVRLRNLRSWKTAWAYNHLRKALLKNPDYAHSWHCNIAMPILDENIGLTHKQANTLASRLMQHLFDVRNSDQPDGSVPK